MSEGTLPAAFANIRAAISNLEGGPVPHGQDIEVGHTGYDEIAGAAQAEALQHGKQTVAEIDTATDSIKQSTGTIGAVESRNESVVSQLEDAIRSIGAIAAQLGESGSDLHKAAGAAKEAYTDGTSKAANSHTELRSSLKAAIGASGQASERANDAAMRTNEAWNFDSPGANPKLQKMIDNVKPLPDETTKYKDALHGVEALATPDDTQAIVAVNETLTKGEENLSSNAGALEGIKLVLEGISSSLQDQLNSVEGVTASIGETHEGFTTGQEVLASVKDKTEASIGKLSDTEEVPSRLAGLAQAGANAGNEYLAPHGA